MAFYTSTEQFHKDLQNTYKTIIDIVRCSGDSSIVNRKRQDTYKKAIENVETVELDNDVAMYSKKLEKVLTEKPKKVMKELFSSGKVVLESKPPYNGACIENGKVIGKDNEDNGKETTLLDSFRGLIVLTGIGIGVGDAAILELVKLGYTNIDQLRDVYDKDKFKTFRKGLQGPLCKYFEGKSKVNKITFQEATTYKGIIDKCIKECISSVENPEKYSIEWDIAGSYARNKTENIEKDIGDLDFVIVSKTKGSNDFLYYFLNQLLDKLAEYEALHMSNVFVIHTPSKPKGNNYATGISLWLSFGNYAISKKVKLEIYGYGECKFFFPYFARTCDVDTQKKIKMAAIKKGYKLTPWGLVSKETGVDVDIDINTRKELFDFLEVKEE